MIERPPRLSIGALLLAAMAVAMVFAGCGSEPQPAPTATPDIPAMVSAAVGKALCVNSATPAEVRPGYCGRLCDETFWHTAGLEEVNSELDRGADIEARDDLGATPLHLAAAANNNPAVIALLLDQCADIMARVNKHIDGLGLTPLHVAAGFNTELAVIALLLDRGAHIDARNDYGETPLHTAATLNAEPAVIALLLDQGADIAARADDGATPLHRAAALNTEPAVIALLLDRGADVEAKTNNGLTACAISALTEFRGLATRRENIRPLLCR